MAQINVRLPDAMLEALDKKRGDKPRNVLVVELFEQYLGAPPSTSKAAKLVGIAGKSEPNESLVDELIVERRVEAEREEADAAPFARSLPSVDVPSGVALVAGREVQVWDLRASCGSDREFRVDVR